MPHLTRRNFLEASALASVAVAIGAKASANEPLLPAHTPIPDNGGRTIYVARHRAGSATGRGSQANPFRTIQQAAEAARPGDTVVVREGVYRERVLPQRGGTAEAPITYMAAPGEAVHIKGSELLQADWKEVGAGIFKAALPPSLFKRTAIRAQSWVDWNPFTEYLTGLPDALQGKLTLGQVAVNGLQLSQAPDDVVLRRSPGSWMAVDNGTALLVHFAEGAPPDRALANAEADDRLDAGVEWVSEVGGVEVTVRDRVFAPHVRGLGYLHVRGFWMEHCANQFPDSWFYVDPNGWHGHQQAGMLGTRTGHHWVIERNVLQHAGTLGLDCGYELSAGPAPIEGGDLDSTAGKWDIEGASRPGRSTSYSEEWMGYHLIRHNVVRRNGANGIMGPGANATEISYNVVEDNNRSGFAMENYEVAAIKMHFFYKGVIEGNLIRHNDAWGIWLDNYWRDARISRNVIMDNKYAGIMMELDFGPATIDNNIIAHNRGDGLYSHDTANMTIAHNWIHANNGIPEETFHGNPGRGVEIRGGGRSPDVPDWLDPDWWKHPDDPSHQVVVKGHRVVNNIVSGQSSSTVMIESEASNTIAYNQIGDLGRVEWDDSQPLIDIFDGSQLTSKSLPAVAAIPEIKEDFYTEPIRSESLLPGPFQVVQQGIDRHILWPVDQRQD